MNERLSALKNQFVTIFQETPTHYFKSSGRMEIIGNHTDHQGGAVLVAAINLSMLAAVKKRTDNLIVLISEGYPRIEVPVNDATIQPREFNKTSAIIRGICTRMQQLDYHVGGLAITMSSKIRPGSGVSSSAAFEMLLLKMLATLYNNDTIDDLTMAKIGQYAENEYFGKPSGLLDQMGIVLGGIHYIEFEQVNLPYYEPVTFPFTDVKFIIINTGGSHTDLTPHYALVKDDMLQIARHYGKKRLIDISFNDLQRDIAMLVNRYGVRPVNRALHFFAECEHVRMAKHALLKHDCARFIDFINKSGSSSERLLENITYEGDEHQRLAKGLADARRIVGSGGVRVHGGGFAGTILVVMTNEEYVHHEAELIARFGTENVQVVEIEQVAIDQLKFE